MRAQSALDLIKASGGSYKPEAKPSSNGRPQPPASTYITLIAPGKYRWHCRSCDWTQDTPTDEPLEHRCGQPVIVRIGDRLADALSSYGITPESVAKFLSDHGMPSGCGGCNARKEWLNRLDERFALGEKMAHFKALMKWGK